MLQVYCHVKKPLHAQVMPGNIKGRLVQSQQSGWLHEQGGNGVHDPILKIQVWAPIACDKRVNSSALIWNPRCPYNLL